MAVVYESTSPTVALGSTAVVFMESSYIPLCLKVRKIEYGIRIASTGRYRPSLAQGRGNGGITTEYCATLNTSIIQDHTD